MSADDSPVEGDDAATSPEAPAAPETDSAAQSVVIVTGMSGAGRSTVSKALEDLGWYVVDNLPPAMLRPLIDVAEHAGQSLPRIAVVVDVRGGNLFEGLRETLQSLRAGTQLKILFLEATDATLVRRFEQVRRPHPLQGEGTILDGIAAERDRTFAIREQADIVIDTSELNIHQLANAVNEIFAQADSPGVRVTITSFGFKYGLPTDADLVADARFLPNPFWVPELRAKNGLTPEVSDYVLGQPGARDFVSLYATALEPVLAGYQRENKRHATIAIGCTGGMHRSVAMAQELAKAIEKLPGVVVTVKHRDLGRE